MKHIINDDAITDIAVGIIDTLIEDGFLKDDNDEDLSEVQKIIQKEIKKSLVV